MSGQQGETALAETGALQKAAKAERRLLRAERAAERRLEKARTRLAKAEARMQRRRAAVSEAVATLRERQAARAAGPDAAPPSTPVAEPSAEADGLVMASDAAPTIEKREQTAGTTVTPILLPDGSPAGGDAPEIVTPRPVRQGNRRRTSPSS